MISKKKIRKQQKFCYNQFGHEHDYNLIINVIDFVEVHEGKSNAL